MVWKLGELQSVLNEPRFYVETLQHAQFDIYPINISTVWLSDLANGEATLLDDANISSSSLCTSINMNKKIEQRLWACFQTMFR